MVERGGWSCHTTINVRISHFKVNMWEYQGLNFDHTYFIYAMSLSIKLYEPIKFIYLNSFLIHDNKNNWETVKLVFERC
jgi:hypothetical protein